MGLLGLRLCLEVYHDDAVEFLDLLGLETVLGDSDITLAYDRVF